MELHIPVLAPRIFLGGSCIFLKICVPLSYGPNAVKGRRQPDLSSYVEEKMVGPASEVANVDWWFRQSIWRSVLYSRLTE